MTKWTKGPWLAATAISSVVGLPVVSSAAMGRSVASITVMPKEMEGHEEFNAEAQANAHLIAAAPELYEAAKRLSDVYDAIWVPKSDAENVICREAWEAMEAALSKATGA